MSRCSVDPAWTIVHGYPAACLFDTQVVEATDGQARLIWNKEKAWRDGVSLRGGCYILRSSVTEWFGRRLAFCQALTVNVAAHQNVPREPRDYCEPRRKGLRSSIPIRQCEWCAYGATVSSPPTL